MRINRFFGNFDFSKKIIKIFDKKIFNQIKNVLRMNVGNKVILSDGKLNEAISRIKNINKDFIEFEVESIYKNQNESKIHSILYCSILKKENFEFVVQKATEVGVKEIIPLICKNTIKLNLKEDRLNKIIKEAVEQSGRGILPILHSPIKFENAVEQSSENDSNLFFDPNGAPFSQMSKVKRQMLNVGIWIGPEGGWNNKEIEIAKENDFKIVSLGNLTLRAETAAIIASYLISNLDKLIK